MKDLKKEHEWLLEIGLLPAFYPKATGVWERDKEMMEEEEVKLQEGIKRFREANKDFFEK